MPHRSSAARVRGATSRSARTHRPRRSLLSGTNSTNRTVAALYRAPPTTALALSRASSAPSSLALCSSALSRTTSITQPITPSQRLPARDPCSLDPSEWRLIGPVDSTHRRCGRWSSRPRDGIVSIARGVLSLVNQSPGPSPKHRRRARPAPISWPREDKLRVFFGLVARSPSRSVRTQGRAVYRRMTDSTLNIAYILVSTWPICRPTRAGNLPASQSRLQQRRESVLQTQSAPEQRPNGFRVAAVRVGARRFAGCTTSNKTTTAAHLYRAPPFNVLQRQQSVETTARALRAMDSRRIESFLADDEQRSPRGARRAMTIKLGRLCWSCIVVSETRDGRLYFRPITLFHVYFCRMSQHEGSHSVLLRCARRRPVCRSPPFSHLGFTMPNMERVASTNVSLARSIQRPSHEPTRLDVPHPASPCGVATRPSRPPSLIHAAPASGRDSKRQGRVRWGVIPPGRNDPPPPSAADSAN